MIDDELRHRLIERVITRDGLTRQDAMRTVNGLHPHDLIRLELEVREHEQPAFTADYDPFARG